MGNHQSNQILYTHKMNTQPESPDNKAHQINQFIATLEHVRGAQRRVGGMKTAEEWKSHYGIRRRIGNLTVVEIIRAIQLDAFKAGMTKAAEVANRIARFNGGSFSAGAIQVEHDIDKELIGLTQLP